MISHFLGVSQTLILKGGHTGSTFSKILGNSHWISPDSGFSQDASTPLSPKLWGKSMFATQEWGGGGGGRGGGGSHTWAKRVCAKLCSLRCFITEPGKRGAFPFWQLLSGTGSQIQFAWKKFRVSKTRHTTPQSTTRCATTQRHAGYYRQENIYMYPEGHDSHITTKSARPGLPLKQEQNS